MCCVCRQRFDKKELFRIIRTPENSVELDLTGKKNGRGVYVCHSADCIRKITNVKMINNALNMEEPVTKDILEPIYEKLMSLSTTEEK